MQPISRQLKTQKLSNSVDTTCWSFEHMTDAWTVSFKTYHGSETSTIWRLPEGDVPVVWKSKNQMWQWAACLSYSGTACTVGGSRERGASVGTLLALAECFTRGLKFMCVCSRVCRYKCACVCTVCAHARWRCISKLECCWREFRYNFKQLFISFTCMVRCVCFGCLDVKKAGYQMSCLWFRHQLFFFVKCWANVCVGSFERVKVSIF